MKICKEAKKFIERAKLFANEYIYWFSEDGSTVPFGRSLIYRFAANAFWGALVWVGVDTELSVSEIKGIIFRNFRWWEEKQISRNGKLSLGYVYPNSFMTEEYNSQFSPLWCLKSAIILDLQRIIYFGMKVKQTFLNLILYDFRVKQGYSFLEIRNR